MSGDKAVVQFDVFHDTAVGTGPLWVVIYKRDDGHWGRYQSNVVDKATAEQIADALQLAGVDPEDPS